MEERDLRARFQALADALPVLIWITGTDGGCTFVNRRWLDVTGRRLDQELGAGWTESIHPDDVDRCRAEFDTALDRRQPFEVEYRLRGADGTWRSILARGVPIHDAGGQFNGFVGSGIDFTERRKAEEALRTSREELAAAMAAGRMGSFDLDLATSHVHRDRNLEELYGLNPGAADSFDDWAALIHPDDRALVLDEVERVLAEGGEYRLEHRLVRPDGQVLWLERRGHTYTDAQGRIAGIRGMVVDITSRKRAEHERAVLFERVSRLQAVTAALAKAGTPEEVLETMIREGVEALGASGGSVAVLDREGRALDVARATGYPPALLETFRHIDLDADLPLAQAARSMTPVTCADLGQLADQYPHVAPQRAAEGRQAVAAFPLIVDDRVIGALGLSFDNPQPFDCAQVEFLTAVAAQCAQALDRTWSYQAEAAARQAAEEAHARLALLADASIVLTGSMDYEVTLPRVARLAIPLLADCCVIDVLVDPDRDQWSRVAAADVDPDHEDLLLTTPPPPWSATDAAGRSRTQRDLDLHAALVVRLEARHRELGVLALGRRGRGPFSDEDRELATGLGTRVAQAVDNALLYRAEQRAHEDAERTAGKLRFLLDVSTTLASPLDPDDRLQQLARQATAAVCDLCLIDLVDREGAIRRVAAVAAHPALQPLADALRRLMPQDRQSHHPSAAAIRSRRTQLCPEVTDDRLEAIASSGTHLEVARQVKPVSYLAVPLIGQERVLGAVTLVTTAVSGRRYGAADVLLAEDMAKRVAMGLERASMHEEMRRIAQTLQAGLLPSVPPSIPGLEVGTRYVAAEEGTVVGGDFFDVFAVGPGAWAVVVGDVCGQGVEAATVTGLARHTVRSSALEHDSPAAVLRHLNNVLIGVSADAARESDPRFCTVCLARVDLNECGAAVTLAMGGHPLPYVLRADGSVVQVGRPGSLLGAVAGAALFDDAHQLGPGDAFVLYTDGVTERRRDGRFFGERGLEGVLTASAGLSADEIAGRVEQAARGFVVDRPADDMAVVVIRVPPR